MKEVDHNKVTWAEIAKAWLKTAARKYYKTRNSIRNGMWPTSVNNLYMSCILTYLLMAVEPECLGALTQPMWRQATTLAGLLPFETPHMLQALPVALVASFAFMCIVMFLRQLILRALLSYRGWMYASLRSPPLKIILWGLLVRLISGYQPSLYSFQRSLPRMSVPPVGQTISKLLESMKCLLDDGEQFNQFERDARDFERTLAPKLQKLLILKSWLTQNYVSDWWTKYVYLMNRQPLANNCNYYIMDQSYWRATDKPVARAASLVFNLLRFKQLIDREELPPLVLRDTIPICMAQYEPLFSTTRVPRKEFDELVHYPTSESKHIVVVARGVYYKLNCYDCENNTLSAKRLEEYIQMLFDDSLKKCHALSDEERHISGLTALERDDWAAVREKLLKSRVNRDSLHLIESAMFIIWLFDQDQPADLSKRARIAFQGNQEHRLWFDKCFNVVVFGDGHCALNCEHTLCDAPAFAHMWEYTLCKDVLECTFDTDGYCFPPMQTYKQAQSEPPVQIRWDVAGEAPLAPAGTSASASARATTTPPPSEISLIGDIRRANEQALAANADVDLKIFDHNEWGKGSIKKCKVSPDAFVQIAIQLAYFKDTGKFVQTYEASMTRLYLNGRTETVRSCTEESCNFVKAMLNAECSAEEKIKLLHVAANKHTILYKDAMNGKGIDRHLFALYVASRGLGYDCKFLADLLTRPWILSTSQTPHTQQTNVPDPNYGNFNDKLCSGGGFMAVAENGYGVSYLFPNESRIFFHITSRKSSPETDTSRFGKLLYDSLDEIRALFDDVQAAESAAAAAASSSKAKVNQAGEKAKMA